MWIQKFQIFKKEWPDGTPNDGLYLASEDKYENQMAAFAWIDTNGIKGIHYVILPVIHFDEKAK